MSTKSIISATDEGKFFFHSVAIKDGTLDSSSLKVAEAKLVSPLECMRVWENSSQLRIATGGKENDLCLWEIADSSLLNTFLSSKSKKNKSNPEILKEQTKTLWKAKNVSKRK